MINLSSYNYAKVFLENTKSFDEMIDVLINMNLALKESYKYIKQGLYLSEIKQLIEKFHISDLVKKILNIMIDNKKLHILSDVIIEMQKMHYTRNNYLVGFVLSANQLNSSVVRDLEAKLERDLNKKVKLINQIDSRLLWGIVIEIGHLQLNLSGSYVINKVRHI